MARLSLDVAIQEQSQGLLKIADNLDKLAKKLEGLGSIKAEPKVEVDTKKAEGKFGAFGSKIAGLAGGPARWEQPHMVQGTWPGRGQPLLAGVRRVAERSQRGHQRRAAKRARH